MALKRCLQVEAEPVQGDEFRRLADPPPDVIAVFKISRLYLNLASERLASQIRAKLEAQPDVQHQYLGV